jgi:hypothetical protein
MRCQRGSAYTSGDGDRARRKEPDGWVKAGWSMWKEETGGEGRNVTYRRQDRPYSPVRFVRAYHLPPVALSPLRLLCPGLLIRDWGKASMINSKTLTVSSIWRGMDDGLCDGIVVTLCIPRHCERLGRKRWELRLQVDQSGCWSKTILVPPDLPLPLAIAISVRVRRLPIGHRW